MESTEDIVRITVTADVPSDSFGPLNPGLVAFTVDQATIKLSSGKPDHTVKFVLSGEFNDGVKIEPKYCILLPADGIRWYSKTFEADRNPWLTRGQKIALGQWLDQHAPTMSADLNSATVTIDRASMRGILNQGETLKLAWGIHMQVARNGPSAWCQIDHDPEVDIEMDE